MTCREMVEFLMQYLEAELPGEQRSAFDAHLAACPSCVTYLDQYRDTVRMGKTVCEDLEGPVPDDVPEELISAILAARARD